MHESHYPLVKPSPIWAFLVSIEASFNFVHAQSPIRPPKGASKASIKAFAPKRANRRMHRHWSIWHDFIGSKFPQIQFLTTPSPSFGRFLVGAFRTFFALTSVLEHRQQRAMVPFFSVFKALSSGSVFKMIPSTFIFTLISPILYSSRLSSTLRPII